MKVSPKRRERNICHLTNDKKIILIISIILFLCGFSIVFSLINMGNDKIYNKIFIQGIDVSGKTENEANEQITKLYREKKISEIKLKHGEYEATISYDQINVNSNINKSIEKAYSIGRKGNIITNNYSILLRNIIKKDINLDIDIDDEAIENTINDVESKLPDVKKESSYYIEENKLIIIKGTKGVEIKKDELKKLIIDKIRNLTDTNNEIEIPTKETIPAEVDIKKIATEIKKEPKNAYISKEPLEIHAEENGIELAVTEEKAKEILKEDKEEYEIPLKITKAGTTVADLGENAFANKLATYTTNYDASNVNRNNNLVLASQKLNGTIINPGEEFSYNKAVGQRTIEAGFKEAKAYAGGKIVLDVGGGICQLSSTLYNSAVLTNLEITERHNHCFLTSYVPASRDATVSWGSVDLKFKNNRKYPIKIVSKVGDGVVTVDIMGIKQEGDYTVIIDSAVTNIIEKETKYTEDNSIEKGKEIITQNGEDGCTSESYKTLLKNGIIISKTLISKDTYNALPTIIKRNT